ncbi:hypothetical protein HYU19_05755 [Candidatus Woesearchaeota archaeon]|nr:hypothetical protein [Candidatus Woesearchaeota archaeon]
MIAIDDYFLREAWSYFAKTPFNFSLVDCTSITVLKTAGATNIATFDKEFAKLKEVVVIR